jgi:hypothetical protein
MSVPISWPVKLSPGRRRRRGERFLQGALRSICYAARIVQRTPWRHSTARAARIVVVLALLGAAWRAPAEPVYRVGGTVDLGYDSGNGSGTAGRAFLDLRPSLLLQLEAPQLMWRVGYEFTGSLTLAGPWSDSYGNQLVTSLAARFGPDTLLIVGAGFTQGNNAYQMTQRAPDMGTPALRAPGNPTLVTASMSENLAWNASPTLRLAQGLSVDLSAPQEALSLLNANVTGSFTAYRYSPNDAIGGEFLPGVAVLTPLVAGAPSAVTVLNALRASWNHDFNWWWNGQLTAGVQQVVTLAGSYPFSLVPTGSAVARYRGRSFAGALAYTHGVTTDIYTGTVAMTDEVVVRGNLNLDPAPVVLGASAGYLHSEPLGAAGAVVAAGTGDALQGDLGATWRISDLFLGFARYSLAYQFNQGSGLEPFLQHVILAGVTFRWSNAAFLMPMPTIGGRVDGNDAVGFPDEGDAKDR